MVPFQCAVGLHMLLDMWHLLTIISRVSRNLTTEIDIIIIITFKFVRSKSLKNLFSYAIVFQQLFQPVLSHCQGTDHSLLKYFMKQFRTDRPSAVDVLLIRPFARSGNSSLHCLCAICKDSIDEHHPLHREYLKKTKRHIRELRITLQQRKTWRRLSLPL